LLRASIWVSPRAGGRVDPLLIHATEEGRSWGIESCLTGTLPARYYPCRATLAARRRGLGDVENGRSRSAEPSRCCGPSSRKSARTWTVGPILAVDHWVSYRPSGRSVSGRQQVRSHRPTCIFLAIPGAPPTAGAGRLPCQGALVRSLEHAARFFSRCAVRRVLDSRKSKRPSTYQLAGGPRPSRAIKPAGVVFCASGPCCRCSPGCRRPRAATMKFRSPP